VRSVSFGEPGELAFVEGGSACWPTAGASVVLVVRVATEGDMREVRGCTVL